MSFRFEGVVSVGTWNRFSGSGEEHEKEDCLFYSIDKLTGLVRPIQMHEVRTLLIRKCFDVQGSPFWCVSCTVMTRRFFRRFHGPTPRGWSKNA